MRLIFALAIVVALASCTTDHNRTAAPAPATPSQSTEPLERAVIVCEGGVIETKHLPPGFGQVAARPAANDPDAVRLGVGTTVGEAEKLLILKTLEATSNNKTRAAEILGISLKTLHNKLKEYGSASSESRAPDE